MKTGERPLPLGAWISPLPKVLSKEVILKILTARLSRAQSPGTRSALSLSLSVLSHESRNVLEKATCKLRGEQQVAGVGKQLVRKAGGEQAAWSLGDRRPRDENHNINRSHITKSLVKPSLGAWTLSQEQQGVRKNLKQVSGMTIFVF